VYGPPAALRGFRKLGHGALRAGGEGARQGDTSSLEIIRLRLRERRGAPGELLDAQLHGPVKFPPASFSSLKKA